MDECLNIGCDVPTWVTKGYADYLSPMEFLFTDLNLRPEEFAAVTKGTGCRVYATAQDRYSWGALYRQGFPAMDTLDKFRAAAHNFYSWGADGGCAFNIYLWGAERLPFYKDAFAILSSPKLAVAGPRHYIYLPTWKDNGGGGPTGRWGTPPTGRYNSQILKFAADTAARRQAFTFRMADGRDGEKLKGTLRFRLYDATLEDSFAFDLNRVAIPDDGSAGGAGPVGASGARPRHCSSERGLLGQVLTNLDLYGGGADLLA
jgi:hypothetical protein